MAIEVRCPFKRGLRKVFCPWPSPHNVLLFLAAVFLLSLIDMDKGQWASWVQAIGSMVAICVAIYIAQLPERRHRLDEAKKTRVMTRAIIHIAEAALYSLEELRDEANETSEYGVVDLGAKIAAAEAEMITVSSVDLTAFPTETMLVPFIRVKAQMAKGISHAKVMKQLDVSGADFFINLSAVDKAANNMRSAVLELVSLRSIR